MQFEENNVLTSLFHNFQLYNEANYYYPKESETKTQMLSLIMDIGSMENMLGDTFLFSFAVESNIQLNSRQAGTHCKRSYVDENYAYLKGPKLEELVCRTPLLFQ